MSYKTDNLKNFRDSINAFVKFNNGGWWKKITQLKDLEYVGLMEGPYPDKEEGYENFYNIIKNNYDDWKAPIGVNLILMVNDLLDSCCYSEDDNYEDFYNFAMANGIKYFKNKNVRIYYKNTIKSKFKAKELNEYFKYNDNIDYAKNIVFGESKDINYYKIDFFEQFIGIENPITPDTMNIIINDEDHIIKKIVFYENGNIDFCDIKLRKNKLIFKNNDNLPVFLYILYCLNFNELIFDDRSKSSCKVNEKFLKVNDNLIYSLANKKNLYEDLGFKRDDPKGFKIIINKYRNFLLEEDGILNGFKLSYIANIYIGSAIKYDDVCISLSTVSSIIEKEMTSEQQTFRIKLQNKNLDFYKSKIIFPVQY